MQHTHGRLCRSYVYSNPEITPHNNKKRQTDRRRIPFHIHVCTSADDRRKSNQPFPTVRKGREGGCVRVRVQLLPSDPCMHCARNMRRRWQEFLRTHIIRASTRSSGGLRMLQHHPLHSTVRIFARRALNANLRLKSYIGIYSDMQYACIFLFRLYNDGTAAAFGVLSVGFVDVVVVVSAAINVMFVYLCVKCCISNRCSLQLHTCRAAAKVHPIVNPNYILSAGG